MDTLGIADVVTEVVTIVSTYWAFIGGGVVIGLVGSLFKRMTGSGR